MGKRKTTAPLAEVKDVQQRIEALAAKFEDGGAEQEGFFKSAGIVTLEGARIAHEADDRRTEALDSKAGRVLAVSGTNISILAALGGLAAQTEAIGGVAAWEFSVPGIAYLSALGFHLTAASQALHALWVSDSWRGLDANGVYGQEVIGKPRHRLYVGIALWNVVRAGKAQNDKKAKYVKRAQRFLYWGISSVGVTICIGIMIFSLREISRG